MYVWMNMCFTQLSSCLMLEADQTRDCTGDTQAEIKEFFVIILKEVCVHARLKAGI